MACAMHLLNHKQVSTCAASISSAHLIHVLLDIGIHHLERIRGRVLLLPMLLA